MMADIPQHYPIIKDLIVDVLVGYVLKGLNICIKPFVAQTEVLFLCL